MKTIVFTGGGTGGHIMPNVSIINELDNTYNICYLGTNGMEKDVISKIKKVKFYEFKAVKFIRKLTLKNLLIPFKLLESIRQCKKYLKEIKPDIIFSKGGFVSIPVCLAASKLNIPILTHESDLTVGLANKIISKKAKRLLCSFKKTAEKYGKNALCVGSPIRQQIFTGDKSKFKSQYPLDYSKPVISITGGSLGAQSINRLIWNNLDKLTPHYTIIHLVGKGKTNRTIVNSKNYIQIEFSNNIEDIFATSDIVISRAGSNTIFELLALKKPMLLLPLSKKCSRGDQILNAEEFKDNGYAEYILEENLDIDNLLTKLNYIKNNSKQYIDNMKQYPIKNGTNKIIKIINETIK